MQTVTELLQTAAQAPGVPHPRTARVNTVKASVQQVLQQLHIDGQKQGGKAAQLASVVKVATAANASPVNAAVILWLQHPLCA